jgi:lysine 2,3-aminomutase
MNAPFDHAVLDRLGAAGLLADDDRAALDDVAARYAVAMPQGLIERARTSAAVARQFVPSAAELSTGPEERGDPIGDARHSPVKGVVHRYPDRVLLMPTLSCAVYCRFCFRRETVGSNGLLTPAEGRAALAYIAAHREIWEVILTGGDPLVLSPRRLTEIVAALDAMAHVKVLRIHTRLPIAAPERIDAALIDVLKRSGKTVFVGIHCNHADELTAEVRASLARLSDAGFPLLSQSVLLRGVNDSVEALEALFRALVTARVKPYYLHQLDLAPGTGHFRVPLAEGQQLVAALRGRVSGIALPTYVLDIPGGAGKVPAAAAYLSPEGDGTFLVRDPRGTIHTYPPAN